MPLNTLGFAAGVVIAQNQGVESDQVMRVALPAAILPNTALGVAVSDMLAQQQVASEQQAASQAVGAAAPTVTGVSPSSGQLAGGGTVTISGTNLTGATGVSFGAIAPVSATVVSDTQITVTAPAGAAGTVDVTVTTPGGTSATSPADQFTYTTKGGSGQVLAGQGWVPAVELTPPQSGHYQPGDVLEVGPGLWQGVGPDARPRYQWYRDGVEVARDGRSAHYKVKAADEGCKLQVQVMYGNERSGYVSSVSGPMEIRKRRRANKSAGSVEEVIIETV